MTFEQVESLPEWCKFGGMMLAAGLVLALMMWAQYCSARLETRVMAKQLSECIGGHKRLLSHLRALTSDLERRLVNRRDVLEELKVCQEVHQGKVDGYTTGCRRQEVA